MDKKKKKKRKHKCVDSSCKHKKHHKRHHKKKKHSLSEMEGNEEVEKEETVEYGKKEFEEIDDEVSVADVFEDVKVWCFLNMF